MIPQTLQWSEDLNARWDAFLKRTHPDKKKALAFFLRTTDPDEQLFNIKDAIDEAFRASLKAFTAIDSAITRAPNFNRMVYKVHRDEHRRKHMRYSYSDPALKGKNRFFAELMTVRAKDPVRCAEKLVTDREWTEQHGDYEQWPKDKHGNVIPWWQKMDDLAAFRIVCNFLRDVKQVRSFVQSALRHYEIEPKDFIWNIERARKRGARSLHLIITSKRDKRRFELQVMTTLQLAWDQSEHVIQYEEKRPAYGGVDETDHHTMLFRSVSDLLYIADETFDRIYDHWEKMHPGP